MLPRRVWRATRHAAGAWNRGRQSGSYTPTTLPRCRPIQDHLRTLPCLRPAARWAREKTPPCHPRRQRALALSIRQPSGPEPRARRALRSQPTRVHGRDAARLPVSRKRGRRPGIAARPGTRAQAEHVADHRGGPAGPGSSSPERDVRHVGHGRWSVRPGSESCASTVRWAISPRTTSLPLSARCRSEGIRPEMLVAGPEQGLRRSDQRSDSDRFALPDYAYCGHAGAAAASGR